MQVLGAAAGAQELGRQPVEQLGMRRRRALDAEVARRRHQAAAEMVLPDAIDPDARRQRILRTRSASRPAQSRRLRDRFAGVGAEDRRASRRRPRTLG